MHVRYVLSRFFTRTITTYYPGPIISCMIQYLSNLLVFLHIRRSRFTMDIGFPHIAILYPCFYVYSAHSGCVKLILECLMHVILGA